MTRQKTIVTMAEMILTSPRQFLTLTPDSCASPTKAPTFSHVHTDPQPPKIVRRRVTTVLTRMTSAEIPQPFRSI